MKDYKKLFERTLPITDQSVCDDAKYVEATKAINKRMEVSQREFSAKSEMSQSKAAGFHFSC